MSMLRVIRSTLGCAGHWIGETYCAVSQKIAERIEKISDLSPNSAIWPST